MSYVGTQAINGALYKKLPFDPDKDFAPVATLATLPFVVVSQAGRAVQDHSRPRGGGEEGPAHLRLGRQRLGQPPARRNVQRRRRA